MTKVRQARLLLVDDDERWVALARVFLRESQWAFDLVWAPTCARARDEMARGSFDAFLVDYRLPDGSGLEFIAELKATQPGPIIMVTGIASRELDYQAMVAGVDEFLLKGAIAPELLERTVRYRSSGAARSRRCGGARSGSEPSSPTVPTRSC